MSGTKTDIDPATELADDEEEPSLPETDPALDLEAAAGTLAAGQAALAQFAKLAPSAPGVYRMTDASGDVLYVGKAKNIRKRVIAYTRPTGHDTRIERMIAATAALEFVSTRDRDRGAAARGQSDQAAAAALQRPAARRQVVPLHPDHGRSLGAADPQASRRAHAAGQLLWAVRLGRGRSTARSRRCERAFLLRSCSDAFFESRTRPCLLLSDQALLRPLHRRDRVRRLRRAGAGGERLPLRQEPAR